MQKSIIDVYRDVLKNAEYWRDKKTGENDEVCDTVSHALYQVASDMENTEEINPVTCKACGEPMYGKVRIHHHTDDVNGKDITT